MTASVNFEKIIAYMYEPVTILLFSCLMDIDG